MYIYYKVWSLLILRDQLCSLLGDLILYYALVLAQGCLDFLVGLLALLDLDLALILELVDLLKQHFAACLLLLVHLVGP